VFRRLLSTRRSGSARARALASSARARTLAGRLPQRVRPRKEGAGHGNKILPITAVAMSALLGTVLTVGDGHVRTAGDPPRSLTSATSPSATPVPPTTPAPLRIAGPAPPSSAWCLRKYGLACYSPGQIQRAYDLPSLYARGLDGRGRTIVIVDSFGSPTIRHDLRVFDTACGLPGPPSLRVLRPVGPVPPYNANNPDMVDAAGETTSDVEAAHAIAPGASILLVETPAAETLTGGGFPQFMAAENYVISHDLGDVISQSFGIPEQNFPSRAAVAKLRYAYLSAHRHHVTVLAATNDFGVTGPAKAGGKFRMHPVVDWPASDPLVTAVGGTRLRLTAQGRRVSPDSAWNESGRAVVARYAGALPWAGGGGRSAIFTRPAYQDRVRAVVGNRRGIPDVALSASFSGASLTFESFTGAPGSWRPAAGTSVATPYFAGLVAIADQALHTRLGLINPLLYRLSQAHAAGLVAVTRGGNTVRFVQYGKTVTVSGYRAGPGYNLATGVGTVDAARFIEDLRALRASSCPAGEDDHGRGQCLR
jgi:subtilase family serine protease